MNNKLRRYNMIDLERLEADRDSARVTFDAFDAIEEYKPALTAIAAYIAGLASLDAALAAQEQEKNND
jgi:hypothetical protein